MSEREREREIERERESESKNSNNISLLFVSSECTSVCTSHALENAFSTVN